MGHAFRVANVAESFEPDRFFQFVVFREDWPCVMAAGHGALSAILKRSEIAVSGVA